MNYKYGGRAKFVKKDITNDKSTDQRILQIILYTCEKYWANANERKKCTHSP